MPGTLVHLGVEAGQEVNPGDEVRAAQGGSAGIHLPHVLDKPVSAGVAAGGCKACRPTTALACGCPTAWCTAAVVQPLFTTAALAPLSSPQVAVVEAMKMRNVLRADVAGVVAAVEARQGDVLGADQVIVRLQ